MARLILGGHHEYPPMLGPMEAVPVGSAEWAERLGLRIKHGVENIEHQGIDRLEPLIRLVLDTTPSPWEVWPDPPCRTPDRFFQYAASTDCRDLAKLIAAYKGEDYSLVRMLRAATAEAEQTIADENEKRGKAPDPHNDVMRVGGQGNAASYLLRRLARERPDILEAYERGQFATPTAAARAAGFKVDTTPLVKLRRAWKRASPEDRETFREEIAP